MNKSFNLIKNICRMIPKLFWQTFQKYFILNCLIINKHIVLFSKGGLIQNIGNYLTIIIIIVSIILTIVFYIKEYNKINKLIHEIIKDRILYLKIDSKRELSIKDDLKNNTNDLSLSQNDAPRKKKFIKPNSETEIISEINANNNTLNGDNNQSENSKDKSEIGKSVYYIDFEINKMPYEIAIEKDKRSYFQYYISLLKMHQIFIFILNGNKDFNSYIMKLCILLFSFALFMVINSLFFNDSFFHVIYLDKGKYNFIYSLPKIIYSQIIASIIFILIKKFFLIHKNILEIKNDTNEFNLNAKVMNVLKTINRKILIFFIFNFTFLIIFWYYLSSFCALYKNTQLYLVKNTLICYIISLIIPFIIFLLPSFFRINGLKGPGECLYKISQIIQIF